MPRLAALAVAAVLAAPLAGCSGDVVPSPSSPRDAVRDAAHMSDAARRASRRLLKELCPKATQNGGRVLTQAEAKRCLGRAYQRYRRELRRYGYDPEMVLRDQ